MRSLLHFLELMQYLFPHWVFNHNDTHCMWEYLYSRTLYCVPLQLITQYGVYNTIRIHSMGVYQHSHTTMCANVIKHTVTVYLDAAKKKL